MSKLLGNLKKGLLVIVSSPSGAGKTTLIEKLCRENDIFEKSVTCTTRPKRPGEIDGRDYHFLSKAQFLQKKEAGEFLESAQVFDHFYGTLKESVDQVLIRGKHLFLVIDTQGALFLKERVEALFVFIQPPSLEELKKRLIKRNAENETEIALRLSWAQEEMAKSRFYDYQVVNDDLDQAALTLKSILIAEEHRVPRLLKNN